MEDNLFINTREGLLSQMPRVFFVQPWEEESKRDHRDVSRSLLSLNEMTKGEYNLVLNSDERAWNRKIIKSLYYRRTKLNSLVMSPNGILLSALSDTIQMKRHTIMTTSSLYYLWIIMQLLIIICIFLLMYVGIFYWEIVNPFSKEFAVDLESKLELKKDVSRRALEANLILTFSLFQIGWTDLSYSTEDYSISGDQYRSASGRGLAAYPEFSLTIRRLKQVTEACILDNAHLTLPENEAVLDDFGPVLQRKPHGDPSPVPICNQGATTLQDSWNFLRAIFLVWLSVIFSETVVFFSVFKRKISHIDQDLSVEEMKSRVDAGVSAISELQILCFNHKLLAVFRSVSLICYLIFNRSLMIVYLELLNKQVTLSNANIPVFSVNYRISATICHVLLATALTIGFLVDFWMAYYYSSIAKTKLPNVDLRLSNDDYFDNAY